LVRGRENSKYEWGLTSEGILVQRGESLIHRSLFVGSAGIPRGILNVYEERQCLRESEGAGEAMLWKLKLRHARYRCVADLQVQI